MANWVPSIGLFFLAACLAWYGVRTWQSGRQAAQLGEASLLWSKTRGRVVGSEALQGSVGDPEMPALYFPWVTYQYVVDGTTYSSTQIAARDLLGSRKAAAAIAARYPVGSEVEVSYDPQAPQTSLLETGTVGTGRTFAVALLSFVVSLVAVAAGIVVPILKS